MGSMVGSSLVNNYVASPQTVKLFSQKEQNIYAMAAAIAQEVLSSIRTVVAFGGEDMEVERWACSYI